MGRGWTLDNVVEAAAASPTFFIPDEEERRSLRVGAVVRLHFVLLDRGEDDPRAERMWVEIESVLGDARYRGYLTNQPTAIDDLAVGDVVEFGAEHVARTLVTKDDPRWFANAELGALVSESVFEDCCRWLYRETPDRPEDSGWRLFSGRETQGQLEDAGRIRVCNVSWLCDHDPSLLTILRREEHVAFERRERGEPWRAVDDWMPESD